MRNRRLGCAIVVSVALHLLGLAGVWVASQERAELPQPVDKRAAVELVMVEQTGNTASAATKPAETPPPPADRPAEEEQEANAAPESEPVPLPPPQEATADTELLPLPPQPPSTQEAMTQTASTPPRPPAETSQPLRFFDLNGTGSESTAVAKGDAIIPASPDQKYRNRPPVYPASAALQGQHGTVVVLIHISPLGLADGASVLRSSGYPMLDQAALSAVQKWRFVPAVRDGAPVPFDMAMSFMFALD